MQLDPGEQAATAHLANDRVIDRRESREQMRSHDRGAFRQSLVDQRVEGRQPDGRSDWIAAKSAAVISRSEYPHEFPASKEQRDGEEPAAERLAEHQPVRHDPFMLTREQPAGAPQATLDLVAQQQHVVCPADTRDLGQITRRRHIDSAFALNRFDEKGRSVRGNGSS